LNDRFGTKSGIRRLAIKHAIPIPPGYICTTIHEIDLAIQSLRKHFPYIAIKHDVSVSGFLSKKIRSNSQIPTVDILRQILHRPFIKGKDIFVVEGWMNNQASVGAHIEIVRGKKPVLCAAWQQIIDSDGVSYIGAGPLCISPKALRSLKQNLQILAETLKKYGAIGSFGPDFLITSDTAVLIELNTRAPYTAFPLEIIKNVKGTIGSGFYATHIHVHKKMPFSSVMAKLHNARLLITKKNPHATGVVPFDIGMLPWKSFTIAAMADTWKETQQVVQKTRSIFKNE
jgi:hypothetical protein